MLGGAGWAGDAVVGYGLGNFVWYHDRQAATGVLSVTLDGGGAVQKSWTPARISPVDGRPVPLAGPERTRAVADFRSRQRCTGLATDRGEAQAEFPHLGPAGFFPHFPQSLLLLRFLFHT